jgi:hypothetical protein
MENIMVAHNYYGKVYEHKFDFGDSFQILYYLPSFQVFYPNSHVLDTIIDSIIFFFK